MAYQNMSIEEMKEKAAETSRLGYSPAEINQEYKSGILKTGTTDRGYEEMLRARGLQQPGYVNAGGMESTRQRQLEAAMGLRNRAMQDPAMAAMQNKAMRENALKAAVSGGVGGPRGAALRGYGGVGSQLAMGAANNTAQQRMANLSALGSAVGSLRGGDISQGLQARGNEQDWRKFRESLAGGWRDRTREEMVRRRALGLEQAGTALDFNAKMNEITLNAARDADQSNWRNIGAGVDAGTSLLKTGLQLGSDGDGGGGWWDNVSGKFK